jgi:parallel beta-helix repeat protein
MTMKRAIGIVALIGMLMMLTQGSTLAKSGARLVVDDDRAQCKDAAFTTLVAAIAAASPGDTILVCPGTYAGALVDKSVRLYSLAGQDRANERGGEQSNGKHDDAGGCLSQASADPNHDAVITGLVTLAANGSEVRGLTFQGASAGVAMNATASVTENCFRANATAITASASGHGSISRNRFIGQTTAAIALNRATGVKIDQNVLVGSAAISLTAASGNVIAHNSATGSAVEAILLNPGSDRNTISDNALSGGPALALLQNNGIRFDGGIGNTVDHNTVTDFGKSGIRLKSGATGNTFRDNRVDHNGLVLTSAAPAGQYGFELSVGATGNLLVGNHMHRNQNLDAWDKNGAGPNTWLRTQCTTSDPAAICASAAPDEASD